MAYAEPEFSFKFGSIGSGDDELDNPTDVILDKNGKNIYVTDKNNDRISIFEDDGDHDVSYGTFCDVATINSCNDNASGADEDGDGQFNNPLSIARDAFGKFFVVDSDNERVQIFDDKWKFQLKFGSSDSGLDDYLGGASGIAIQESTKEILVSNVESDAISVFDSTGDFMFEFDSFDGNEKFDDPTYMIIDDSNEMLYVSDSAENRIVMFELVTGTTCPSGTDEVVDGVCFVEEFGLGGSEKGEFNNPAGLVFDETNDLLYVADSGNDRIQIFQIIDDNTCPSSTEEVIDGVCFVEEFGGIGSENGKFDTPMGIALDTTKDLLFVADSKNDRIQAFEINAGPAVDLPSKPIGLNASPISSTSIIISWDKPETVENAPTISGYKIEYKMDESYITITENTASTSTSFIHKGLDSEETYSYRVYAINSEGTSVSSSVVSTKPAHTTIPSGLTATAISPSQIKLSWLAPSETFGQSISGYEIKREITPGVFEDDIGSTNSQTKTHIVSNLQTDKTYTYVVSAKIGYGFTQESEPASATPREDSTDTAEDPVSSTVVELTVSTPPIKLTASTVSSTQVDIAWSPPAEDGNSPITGYKIEVKTDQGPYKPLVEDTKTTTGVYTHRNLVSDSKYTYRVSAINDVGTSEPSNLVSATPMLTSVKINPLGKLTIDEGKLVSFTVKLVDNSIRDVVFTLDNNPPTNAKIISNTGMFSWTPSSIDGGKSHIFDVVATKDGISDRKSITITVNDVIKNTTPEPKDTTPEPAEPKTDEPKELGIASFVDKTKDPQYYVDRYTNEATYKKWFDDNFSEYDSIYQAVGIEEELLIPASFVDNTKDPQYYVDRYTNEATYKKWFDDNFSEYDSIYQAVGIEEPKIKEKKFGICGPGTKLIEGVCTIVERPVAKTWWKFW